MKKIFFLSLSLILSLPAFAQKKVDVVIKSQNYPEIELLVNVRDSSTNLGIYGLSKSDFSVVENGFIQNINFFNAKAQGQVDPIDIVFVFDQTGSMQDEINAVKDNVSRFADALKGSNMDFRLGLVTFSDRVEEVKNFTPDVNQFKNWLGSIFAAGGGDAPENALDALAKAAEFKFREKAKVVFILITDAPFHQRNAVTKRTLLPLAKQIKLEGIEVYCITLQETRYEWLAKETNGLYFNITDDFSSIIDQMAIRLTAQYSIKYIPTNASLDDTWRNVEIKAEGMGTTGGKYRSKADITVSSTLYEENRPSDAYAAGNMVDGNPSTAWNEGAKGDGIGEWVRFGFAVPKKVKAINIIAGYTKTREIYKKNNRIKQLKVSFSDGRSQIISLEDTFGSQRILIDQESPSTFIKLEILAVYKGTHYRDTCITEIFFEYKD